jgi:hypothetical protein
MGDKPSDTVQYIISNHTTLDKTSWASGRQRQRRRRMEVIVDIGKLNSSKLYLLNM